MLKHTTVRATRDEKESASFNESAKRPTSEHSSFSELIHKYPAIRNKTERIQKLRLRLGELQEREKLLTVEERSRIFHTSFSEHIASLDERIRNAKVAFADELGRSARCIADKKMEQNAERLAILAHHNFDHVLDELSVLTNCLEMELSLPKQEAPKTKHGTCVMDDFEITEPESDTESDDYV